MSALGVAVFLQSSKLHHSLWRRKPLHRFLCMVFFAYPLVFCSVEQRCLALCVLIEAVAFLILYWLHVRFPFYRFGFHWPPFTSISHLHLHVVSPLEQMSALSRFVFMPGSAWFCPVSFPYTYRNRGYDTGSRVPRHRFPFLF